MLYARTGSLERAADTYREAIRLEPGKLAYRYLLADVYACLGDQDRAQAEYSGAAEIDHYDADFVIRARRFMLGGCW